MSSLNDQKIFNAIFNPNTPFDDESETKIVQTSKCNIFNYLYSFIIYQINLRIRD